jgi:hypothetical protein
MHHSSPEHSRHAHNYALDTTIAERRTRIVIALTAAMMLVEIAAGITYNSMALLADGWLELLRLKQVCPRWRCDCSYSLHGGVSNGREVCL